MCMNSVDNCFYSGKLYVYLRYAKKNNIDTRVGKLLFLYIRGFFDYQISS